MLLPLLVLRLRLRSAGFNASLGIRHLAASWRSPALHVNTLLEDTTTAIFLSGTALSWFVQALDSVCVCPALRGGGFATLQLLRFSLS